MFQIGRHILLGVAADDVTGQEEAGLDAAVEHLAGRAGQRDLLDARRAPLRRAVGSVRRSTAGCTGRRWGGSRGCPGAPGRPHSAYSHSLSRSMPNACRTMELIIPPPVRLAISQNTVRSSGVIHSSAWKAVCGGVGSSASTALAALSSRSWTGVLGCQREVGHPVVRPEGQTVVEVAERVGEHHLAVHDQPVHVVHLPGYEHFDLARAAPRAGEVGVQLRLVTDDGRAQRARLRERFDDHG